MQPYKHELKINFTFHPKDFKFGSNTKRKAFEEEIIKTIKNYLLLQLKDSYVNGMEFDGGFVKHHGMRPHGTLLRQVKDDFIYSVADFYDVKVEEEEEK